MGRLGYKHTENAKKRISISHKGRIFSAEHREKLKQSHVGNKLSKEHISRMSNALKGHIVSEETKSKIRKANTGKKASKKTRLKLSESHRGKFGIKSSNWQGGIKIINKLIRGLFEYKIWRSGIFKRDNWTCQTCHKRGCYLEAHHKKQTSKIIKENNIKTSKEAVNCKELWGLNNGVTLCKDCHNLTKGRVLQFHLIAS